MVVWEEGEGLHFRDLSYKYSIGLIKLECT